jgi:hypothetical protein
MIRAVFALLALTTAAAAQPVTLQCKMVGGESDYHGTLVVTIDEAARHVEIEAAGRPGVRNDYRDGAIGPTITVAHSSEEQDVHEQFFWLKPGRIEFGWRWPSDGKIGHYVWIDAAALTQRKPCLFHSIWDIART